MGEPEGRGSSSISTRKLHSGPDPIAVPPSDRQTPTLEQRTPNCDSKPRKAAKGPAERNASHRPKVSVMLITYNHAKYIAQALESVLMQETNFDFEINVIEDCSTDGTQEIILRYVREHPHIVKPYLNKKNIGFKVTQKNFYRGFQTLDGDYLAILEGDDYWTSPHKLQRQVDFLEANPDFAMCAHNTMKVYEDGSQEPHRFLYWGQRGDATVEDVILLRAFFHTTGILYRNVFKGVPPRQFRNKWSCDIFIMIAHAVHGKVHHIDEDMAVYRVHPAGRFSGMSPAKAWFFNIDGLRHYNAWLRYRYLRTFAESISRYCDHVLNSHGKDGVAPLTTYQHAKVVSVRAVYRSIFQVLTLPRRLPRMVLRRTRVADLPPLGKASRWDLVWGLHAKPTHEPGVAPYQSILKLTALDTGDEAELKRHALSQCIGNLISGGTYRVAAWVKSLDGTNIQLQLRDSVRPETGAPANEGEVRFDLSKLSVLSANGLPSSGIDPVADGWQKAWADITTDDGRIFAYLGMLRKTDHSHVFDSDGEQLLFGGFEVSPRPST